MPDGVVDGVGRGSPEMGFGLGMLEVAIVAGFADLAVIGVGDCNINCFLIFGLLFRGVKS